MKNIRTYWDNKPINDQYKKSFNKKRFYSQHETEIKLFTHAKSELKKTISGTVLPIKETVEKDITTLEEKRSELMKEYNSIIANISKYENALTKFETYSELLREQQERGKSTDELE